MPSLHFNIFLMPVMSEKKSPPRKEKPFMFIKSPQPDRQGIKRKLIMPCSPTEEDLQIDLGASGDKRGTPKRKRAPGVGLELSPPPSNMGTPKTPGSLSRIAMPGMPLSERQQVAMLMKMTEETSQGDQSPKPLSPQPMPSKRTPGEKKVHHRNEKGETPLHIAAIRGDVKETKKLIKAGADVNVTDYAGWTPLHEACNRGWIEVARQLMKAGANVNVQGLENDTPIHDASTNGHHKLVELLLKHGANPLQQNRKGDTAINVAASPDIVELLKKEIISSSCDSSSVDDARSPTSPESSLSAKEDADVDDFTDRYSKPKLDLGLSSSNSRRVLIPESPEKDKSASPRYILKFSKMDQYADTLECSRASHDPHFTYRVSLETNDSKMFVSSYLNSPDSSLDSDLYNPHLENVHKYSFNNKGQANDSLLQSMELAVSPGHEFHRNPLEGMLPSLPVPKPKLKLKPQSTQPFSPHLFEDISDPEEDAVSKSQKQSSTSNVCKEPQYIPKSEMNHTELNNSPNSDLSNSKPHMASVVVSNYLHSNEISSLLSNSSVRKVSSNSNGSVSCLPDSSLNVCSSVKDSYSPPLTFPLDEYSSISGISNSCRTSPTMLDRLENDQTSPKLDKSENRESKPGSPKVPPLKIVIPSKTAASATVDSDSLKLSITKHKLPYVINPTQEMCGGFELTLEKELNLLADSVDPSRVSDEKPSEELKVTTDSSVNPDTCVKEEEPELENKDTVKEEVEEKEKEPVKTKEKEEEAVKEEKEKEERTTRVTRSTARSQLLLKQQQQENKPEKSEKSEKNEKVEKQEKQVEPAPVTEVANPKPKTEEVEESSDMQLRRRKLRPKPDATYSYSDVNKELQSQNQTSLYEKPPNPFESYLDIRKKISSRRRSMVTVQPKPPQSFRDFLMVQCGYVIEGNQAGKLSVPMLSPPNSVIGSLRDLFLQQEKKRYELRLRHKIEKEKLMLSIEQEIIREHSRAARALANQSVPLSVCTVLRDQEIYNAQEIDQAEDQEKNVRTRYNGRQFISWLKDVDDKYEKIKEYLILRHHHEADSLFAVQKMDWEWKMKEAGLCDHNSKPVIDELHIPMVQVSDDFSLYPT